MLSSIDETYAEYIQHVMTAGGGVDDVIVRETLQALGFSGRALAKILGEAESCCTTTDTSTSTNSVASGVKNASAHLSSPREDLREHVAPSHSAPREAHTPCQEASTYWSSSSTSSPATTGSASVPSNHSRPGRWTALPRTADESASPAKSHSEPSHSPPSRPASSLSGPHTLDRTSNDGEQLGSATATPQRVHDGHTAYEANLDASNTLLFKLEAMRALLARVPYAESCESTPPSPPRSSALIGTGPHNTPCPAPSTRTSEEGDDEPEAGYAQRCDAEQRVYAGPQDLTPTPTTSSASSSLDWNHDEAGQASRGSHIHSPGSWRRAAPPPLWMLAQDGEVSVEAGAHHISDEAAARHTPPHRGSGTHLRASRPQLCARPAIASYHEGMTRWLLAHRPATTTTTATHRSNSHCGPRHTKHTAPGRVCGPQSSRPIPTRRNAAAATEPNVHTVVMKASVKELTAGVRLGATRPNAMILPSTLARQAKSDPVSLALRYRVGWNKQEARIRQKKDVALWETRRRLLPTD